MSCSSIACFKVKCVLDGEASADPLCGRRHMDCSKSLLSNINHVCVIHSLQMMLISSSFTCANKMTTNNSSSMALKAVLVSDVVY